MEVRICWINQQIKKNILISFSDGFWVPESIRLFWIMHPTMCLVGCFIQKSCITNRGRLSHYILLRNPLPFDVGDIFFLRSIFSISSASNRFIGTRSNNLSSGFFSTILLGAGESSVWWNKKENNTYTHSMFA